MWGFLPPEPAPSPAGTLTARHLGEAYASLISPVVPGHVQMARQEHKIHMQWQRGCQATGDSGDKQGSCTPCTMWGGTPTLPRPEELGECSMEGPGAARAPPLQKEPAPAERSPGPQGRGPATLSLLLASVLIGNGFFQPNKVQVGQSFLPV